MALMSKVLIEIDGTELEDFLHLKIDQSIYGPHEFEVAYPMLAFRTDNFVMDESKKYIGSTIAITIDGKEPGSDTVKNLLFFKGLITHIRTWKPPGEVGQVIFSGYSPDILLADKAGSRTYLNKSLKQIADEVTGHCPTDILKLQNKASLTPQLPYVVRYDESSYEFLRRLASRYGQWLFYDGKELIFGSLPNVKTKLEEGSNMEDFNVNLFMEPQNFKYIAYDYMSAEAVEAEATQSKGKSHLKSYGNAVFDKAVKHYSEQAVSAYAHLNVPNNKYAKELKSVAELEEGASALNTIQVYGESINPELKPGCKASIKTYEEMAQGEIDYGDYIITSVQHSCDNMMTYRNNFTGIPAEAKIPDYTDPSEIRHCDVQSAVVTDNNDPEKLGRVKVSFFWQDQGQETPWIRVMTPHSGAEKGIYFIPETGEEVLVAFEHGDAERPYVAGSFFHGQHKPDSNWVNNRNEIKAIRTRGGNTIEFIDSPGSEEIVMYLGSDKDSNNKISLLAGSPPEINIISQGKLNLEAESIEMKTNSGAIDIKSAGALTLESGGTMTLDSMTSIEANANTDVTIKGLNINIEATASLTAKGNASAELSAGGNTTVKGAIVMIN